MDTLITTLTIKATTLILFIVDVSLCWKFYIHTSFEAEYVATTVHLSRQK